MEQAAPEERWIRWEPAQGLSPKYSVNSISDSPEGFTILLSDINGGGKRVEVTPEAFVHSFRRTDGWLRLKTLNALKKKYGDNFCMEWTFFRVENSSYISWLYRQSGELIMSLAPTHFALVADNLIIDIVEGWGKPKVKLL